MARKQTSAKTKARARPSAKTTKTSKASTKAKKGARSSEPSSRAKASAAALVDKSTSPAIKPRGRPKNSADIWTEAHIEEVAGWMWDYIETTQFPTEAGFCIRYRVAFQRLCEFPLLRELKEFLFAKRQDETIQRGIRLGQGESALGGFLAKLAANAGSFSFTDKSEVAHSGSIGTGVLKSPVKMARAEWEAAARAHQGAAIESARDK